ncbi:hypothetical protein OG225_13145 [Nocardia sp. NBC_01377]|uniref:hypothetical protein n=1 Tax=Nocardia sp. NBC_01377 TaxID=2903595 RepID=UPI0032529AC6
MPLPANLPRQQRLNWQIALAAGTLTATQHDELAHLLLGSGVAIEAIEAATRSRRLSGLTMASDGYLPFRDSVDVAAEHGVAVIVEPAGALHGDTIVRACREHDIALVRPNRRMFHH